MVDTKARMEQMLENCGYQHPHIVQTQIVEALKVFPRLKLKRLKRDTSGSSLSVMDGIIGINHTTLQLFIPQNYPLKPPSVFIKPSEGFSLIPKKNMTPSGSLKTESLNTWATKTVGQATLVSLIQVYITNHKPKLYIYQSRR